MRFGIIGAGNVGKTLAQSFIKFGHQVALCSTRDPQTLRELTSEIGCSVMTIEDAISFGDVIVLATPMSAIKSLSTNKMAGKIVIDTCNYASFRDGEIPDLLGGKPTSVYTAEHFPGAKITKAFSSIAVQDFRAKALPGALCGKIALPVSGDVPEAKAVVMSLVESLGFEAHDAGSLAESWRMQYAQPAFCADVNKGLLQKLLAEAESPIIEHVLPTILFSERRRKAKKNAL